MKFEIKNRWNGSIIFSIETDSLKLAIEAAIKTKADLSWADLSYADLRSANLRSANLRCADLSWADLSYADLSSANLRSANLRCANLRCANFSSADLSSADLSYANLISADLRCASLSKYVSTALYILLDQPGKIRAYKLVKPNGEGPYNGGIIYSIGNNYEIKEANTNENNQCGSGINLATLDWCLKEWKEGYRILVAEFEAKDIAAIPIGSDGKFRVHRCSIVGEKSLAELNWPPKKSEV